MSERHLTTPKDCCEEKMECQVQTKKSEKWRKKCMGHKGQEIKLNKMFKSKKEISTGKTTEIAKEQNKFITIKEDILLYLCPCILQ